MSFRDDVISTLLENANCITDILTIGDRVINYTTFISEVTLEKFTFYF